MATPSPHPSPSAVTARTSKASRTTSTPWALLKGVTSGRCTRRSSMAVSLIGPGRYRRGRCRDRGPCASKQARVGPEPDAAEDPGGVVDDAGLRPEVDRHIAGGAAPHVEPIGVPQGVE